MCVELREEERKASFVEGCYVAGTIPGTNSILSVSPKTSQ